MFDSRALDDSGELTSDFADPWWWRSVIPQCTFSDDGVERIELQPITLQRTAGRPARGTPVLATDDEADEIIDRLAELSEPFGTEIERDDGWVVT